MPNTSTFISFTPSSDAYPVSSYSLTDNCAGNNAGFWTLEYPYPLKQRACLTAFDLSNTALPYFEATQNASLYDSRIMCRNNSSLTPPTKSEDIPLQHTPIMASFSTTEQPNLESKLPTSCPSPNAVTANILSELFNKIKNRASSQHVSSNEDVTDPSQEQITIAKSLNELAYSSVGGAKILHQTTESKEELDADDSLSTQFEREPISSSVDSAERKLVDVPCSKIQRTISDLASPEPHSSSVDGVVLQKSETKLCSIQGTFDENNTTESEPLAISQPLEEVHNVAEPYTIAFVSVKRSECEIIKIGTREIQTVKDSFENVLGVNRRETSSAVLKKDSLSEITGKEISNSEFLANVENSELALHVVKKSNPDLRSKLEKSIGGSETGMEWRQKAGPVNNLRQRQSAPAGVTVSVVKEIISSEVIEESQRIEAVFGDSLYQIHDSLTQDVHSNDTSGQSTARVEQPHSVCSTTYLILLGLCLTTVFIALNHLYVMITSEIF